MTGETTKRQTNERTNEETILSRSNREGGTPAMQTETQLDSEVGSESVHVHRSVFLHRLPHFEGEEGELAGVIGAGLRHT